MNFGENWTSGFRTEVVEQYHDLKHVYSTGAGEDKPCRIKF